MTETLLTATETATAPAPPFLPFEAASGFWPLQPSAEATATTRVAQQINPNPERFSIQVLSRRDQQLIGISATQASTVTRNRPLSSYHKAILLLCARTRKTLPFGAVVASTSKSSVLPRFNSVSVAPSRRHAAVLFLVPLD